MPQQFVRRQIAAELPLSMGLLRGSRRKSRSGTLHRGSAILPTREYGEEQAICLSHGRHNRCGGTHASISRRLQRKSAGGENQVFFRRRVVQGLERLKGIDLDCQVGSLLFRVLLWKRATAPYPGKVQQPFRSRLLSVAFAVT
jgi:hypothetical protein